MSESILGVAPLPVEALFRSCDPGELPFDTTAEAPELNEFVGQARAAEAISFGIGIRREGYNLFALGPQGIGKQTLLNQFLDGKSKAAPTPADWVYVANFADATHPQALRLPAGLGARLRSGMEAAVAQMGVAMRSTFKSEEYRTRKQGLVNLVQEQEERALGEVQEQARDIGVAVLRTETGIVLAPMKDGQALEAAEFRALPEEEREQLAEAMDKVRAQIHALLRQFHEWAHLHHEAIKTLDRETAAAVAHRVLDKVRTDFLEHEKVLEYLAELEKDVLDHTDDFMQTESEGLEAAVQKALHRDHSDGASFRRYQVNLMVDNGGREGVPVVYEDSPTLANLIGRVEHVSQLGALVTDFTLIRPGALHRASGGYLLLDAMKLLQHSFSWEALKRAIRTREIRMDSIGSMLGLVSTVSLEPEPIKLDGTKVVLFGERILYYLLATYDPDFLELFKVMVDFEDSMDRGPQDQAVYAQLIASLARKEELRALDRGAVARVIEQASRLAEDAEKLSVHMRPVVDLLREADYWAQQGGREVIGAQDVLAAIEAQLRRAGRVRERFLEHIRRDQILIDTQGSQVGQVNGLSVMTLGDYRFAMPSRITARVRMGKGEVVDIERQVDLGGPIHSKGVLILTGFLGSRYATRVPLSLAASLVFEQSYSGVDGDSASLGELCVLITALAEAPIKQSLAVTGSVNQHGQVQPIGGVNEKIEGFFDVCQDRGLTGDQGVIIPVGNVESLMLRAPVREAVASGQFRIYAVSRVDQALELLTGCSAGERDEHGQFPADSLNQRAEARLRAFAEDARSFLARIPGGDHRLLHPAGGAIEIVEH